MATKSKFIEEDDATATAGLKDSAVNVTKLLYKDKKTDNSIQLFLKLFFIVFFFKFLQNHLSTKCGLDIDNTIYNSRTHS